LVGFPKPFFELTYAPIIISSSEEMLSTVVVVSFPFTERAGTPTICSVPSSVPFTKILIDLLSNVAAKNVHSSLIVLVDSTVVHLIPSNMENVAIFCGFILLLIESENNFSLLITVNSCDPCE